MAKAFMQISWEMLVELMMLPKDTKLTFNGFSPDYIGGGCRTLEVIVEGDSVPESESADVQAVYRSVRRPEFVGWETANR